VLAEHRQEFCLDVGVFTFPIALNADPLYRPTLVESVLFIQGDVVLGLTRDYAGLTTGAPVNVNYHSPFEFVLVSQGLPPGSP
jgi:hypothetical protein